MAKTYADLLAPRIASLRETYEANMALSPRNDLNLAFMTTVHMGWLLDEAERSVAARRAIKRACEIIETADARLLATDGPCGGLPPNMSLDEWRELYVTLDEWRNTPNKPDGAA